MESANDARGYRPTSRPLGNIFLRFDGSVGRFDSDEFVFLIYSELCDVTREIEISVILRLVQFITVVMC